VRHLIRIFVLCGAPLAELPAQAHHGLRAPEVMYHFPRWSPDERSIVVVGMTTTGTNLLVFPVTGGKPDTIPLGDLQVVAADWTRAGGLTLVADVGGGVIKSYVMDRDGSRRREVRRDSVTSANADSSVLLFESVVAGSSTIFAMNARRATARALTSGAWAEQASLSPDGGTIVFERRLDPNRMEQSEVVLMDPSGAHARVIAAGTDPSWSPDGRLILYKAMDTSGELWVSLVDPATKRSRRLAKGVHPQWSPSGKRIVYMLDRPDHSADIFIISRDGGTPACVTCAR
jgi:Tol biopolymer transport system component